MRLSIADVILRVSHDYGPKEDPGVAPESAEADLRRSLGPGGASHRASTSTHFSEAEALVEWERKCGRLLERDEWLGPVRDGGMEHDLWFNERWQRFVKITRPGGFGRFPKIINRKISMRSASPLEYLERLRHSNELFADDWRVVGVLIDNGLVRMVTSQPLIVGERPAQADIDSYMNALGFERVAEEKAYRHNQQLLGVFDTHKGNFLKTCDGQVFAIDVIPAKLTLETNRLFQDLQIAYRSWPDEYPGPPAAT
ncbi:MAG: hypothetical protein AAF585_06995 [Verrucomicrobiota bacterium]